MEPLTWTLIAVAAVSLLSLIGAVGLSFGLLRNHRVMMTLIALAAGTLLGDAFLHLLPEAAADGFTPKLGLFALAGFMAMYTIEAVLHRSHSHGEHTHDDHAQEHHGHEHVEPFGWINLVGDGLHNLLDGVIIAAAFLIDTAAGLATTLAVLVHEIPQELGDFAVLVRSGMKPAKALFFNLLSALVAFLGAAIVFAIDIDAHALESIIVPMIAGAFVYIAAADLVPELHHHRGPGDMATITIGLLVGLALMFGLLELEQLLPESPGHDH